MHNSIVLLFNTFRKISFQMGKKPDDNENRQSIKKMIHSEMMDRGLVVDKKKKTRSSRDRSRPVSSSFISRVTKIDQSPLRSSKVIFYAEADFLFQWDYNFISQWFYWNVLCKRLGVLLLSRAQHDQIKDHNLIDPDRSTDYLDLIWLFFYSRGNNI